MKKLKKIFMSFGVFIAGLISKVSIEWIRPIIKFFRGKYEK